MVINNHRKHSNFALKHFMAGGCYTPDAAYVLLYAQLEGLQMDMAAGEAGELKNKAKRLELESLISNLEIKLQAESIASDVVTDVTTEIQSLRAKADFVEFEAAEKMFKINFKGTKNEVVEITEMLEKLKPLCMFWCDDILKMEQDMCQTEWGFELAGRAENMILAQSFGIPYDHLATMRQHPAFESLILPRIGEVNGALQNAAKTGKREYLDDFLKKPKLIVDLLEGNATLENKPTPTLSIIKGGQPNE